MVEVVFENFVNYLRSGNTDKLNIISFQQNQQHKINLSTQLIFYRILTKTVVQLKLQRPTLQLKPNLNFESSLLVCAFFADDYMQTAFEILCSIYNYYIIIIIQIFSHFPILRISSSEISEVRSVFLTFELLLCSEFRFVFFFVFGFFEFRTIQFNSRAFSTNQFRIQGSNSSSPSSSSSSGSSKFDSDSFYSFLAWSGAYYVFTSVFVFWGFAF
ncbi:Hypothetical_protein [Hexamita inflata]|uniref:Hypothetical_protein n=1 Tax=Hexamita inflata TaxID=28002 RepID=A0AA86QRD9_9EUKA|nr:Hypothetical protein HINF_LOCUS49317 [Hexamita inflata]